MESEEKKETWEYFPNQKNKTPETDLNKVNIVIYPFKVGMINMFTKVRRTKHKRRNGNFNTTSWMPAGIPTSQSVNELRSKRVGFPLDLDQWGIEAA